MIASYRAFGRALIGPAFLLVVLSAGTAAPLHAQDRPFPYALGKRDLVMVPAGIGLAALGLALRDATDPITLTELARLHRDDVNWFDRTATGNWSESWGDRSDEYRNLAVGTTFLSLGFEGARSLLKGRPGDGVTLAVMLGELYTFLLGTSYTTKALVGRKRPYAFNPRMTLEEKYQIASSDGSDVFFSFFSGHATSAFAAATFTSTVFTDLFGPSKWSHLVWGSTLMLAGMTAYSRVKAGKHYPSDVIVGAAVGSAIGYLVPRLHRVDADGRVRVVVGPTQLGLRVRF
jgi:membrane-associated phospholipid phosphatase